MSVSFLTNGNYTVLLTNVVVGDKEKYLEVWKAIRESPKFSVGRSYLGYKNQPPHTVTTCHHITLWGKFIEKLEVFATYCGSVSFLKFTFLI